MAARAPTTFTTYHDLRAFLAKEPITASMINSVVQDLHMIRRCSQASISDVFGPFTTTSASYVEVARWYLPHKDKLYGAATDMVAEWSALAWSTGGGSNVDLRLTTTAAASSSSTISLAATATPTWTSTTGATALNVPSEDAMDTVVLDVKSSAGGAVYVAGFGLFVPIG